MKSQTNEAEGMQTVDWLMGLEDKMYARYGVDSRPAGKTWAFMVLDLAALILDDMEPGEITKEVLDELTENNYHTARRAAVIALRLNKYM